MGTQLIAPLQNIGVDVASPALAWLVAARFVQAAGGGAVVPVAMAAGDCSEVGRRGQTRKGSRVPLEAVGLSD